MMKTLYLLRHAHTLPAALPVLGDFERTLSPQGIAEAGAVGAFMKKNELLPDAIVSSSALRTTQTTKLVLEKIEADIPCHFERSLYLASASKLLAYIHATNGSIQELLLVSHNPGVADFALEFGNIANYSPGTLSIFKADCANWADFETDIVTLDQIFEP
jgi:phosphohistidine phosphatase